MMFDAHRTAQQHRVCSYLTGEPFLMADMLPPAAGASKKTVAQILGEVTWLLTQSRIHKQLFVGDLEWFVMPPVLLEQFRVFNGPQHPVGVALYARVSQDTDARLEAGAHKLRADEWKSGDQGWLIELVAPFGGEDELLADFASAIFPTEPFKMHRLGEGGVREVVTYDTHLSAAGSA